jgi:hypothetical protein
VGPVTGVLFLACAVQFAALASNALGLFGGAEAGVYFGGLFVHFLGASFFFIRLLYGAFPAPGP